MARRNALGSPASLTSSELLDYIAGLQGKQVHAHKRLAGGVARSSYSIHYYPESRTYDTFSSIGDEWFEATREQFIACHGDGERIWHLDIIPTPKTTQPPDLLIALAGNESELLHNEENEFYGIQFVVEICSVSHGEYETLQEAMKQVRVLDRMGYKVRVFRSHKQPKREDEILHWIPILRLESKNIDKVHLNDFPKNMRVMIAEEIRRWREQQGAEKITS